MTVFHVIPNWTAYLGAAIIVATIILLTFIKDRDVASSLKWLLRRSRDVCASQTDAEQQRDLSQNPSEGHDNVAFENDADTSPTGKR